MDDINTIVSRLKEVSDMLFDMFKDETDKQESAIRYDQFKAVDDAYDLLKERQWIPVSERLPKSMVNKVLVWLEHDDLVGYIGYGHYEKYKGVEEWYDLEHEEPFSKNGYRVTHWMPLPEPPQEG